VVTGNPIRTEVAAVRREPVSPPLVAIFGGSLGAQRINDAALDLYGTWRTRDDVVIRHVAGARNVDACRDRLATIAAPEDALAYELVAYEDHMDALYARATLAVCRAGAVTVAELAAVGLPAVLVPLPGAPGDHQTRNALTLVDAGAAVLVPDAELDGAMLAGVLTDLLGDPAGLAEMSAAARSLARTDAAARLADLVEDAARGGRSRG
jgi:UDP-N-acetylglucosamine--N-acetylmuramyl-(pentapeptide) pyrophosphoryl-undecaprenol N-acetylglucosamine transferase